MGKDDEEQISRDKSLRREGVSRMGRMGREGKEQIDWMGRVRVSRQQLGRDGKCGRGTGVQEWEEWAGTGWAGM